MNKNHQTARRLLPFVVGGMLAACGGGGGSNVEADAALSKGYDSKLTVEQNREFARRQLEQDAAFAVDMNSEPESFIDSQALATKSKMGAALQKADSPSLTVRAIADFDGDGKADVLSQSSTGAVSVTLMDGTAAIDCGSLGAFSAAIMGTGDFNGDGKADIVWRNMTSGAVSISLMSGKDVLGWLNVGVSPIALNVKLEGIGDFDGNGRADMLWRNQSTGRAVMSYHNVDGSVASWPEVSNYIALNTSALKVGDINGDGNDDIVWRNMGSGNVVISLMDGNLPTWKAITVAPIALNVALEAVGDFDDNGRADLLWRNTTTGRSLMSYHALDGAVESWPVVSEFINPATTSAVGVGDFDGDGRTDIYWRNLTSGNSVISLMNGSVPNWQSTSFSACQQRVPHTGITPNQCVEAGNLTSLVPCNSAGALSLNAQQDGHRGTVNAMSYSAVGNNPRTSCVKDNVTGLIWEGKQPSGSGPRSGDKTFTNFDSTTKLQKVNFVSDDDWQPTYTAPSQSEVDSGDNSVGYVRYVNSLNLCGFNDWRLPSAQELMGLVDFSKTDSILINEEWFPNSPSHSWTYQADTTTYAPENEPEIVQSTAWLANFSAPEAYAYSVVISDTRGVAVSGETPESYFGVRLVRGEPWNRARFSYSTSEYPGDAANNVVIDKKTGLQWRRCEEGRSWNGSACSSGYSTKFSLIAALAHTSQQTGWRMPNIKELFSLVELQEYGNQSVLNSSAFPGADDYNSSWPSTPRSTLIQVYDAETDAYPLQLGGHHVKMGTLGGNIFSTGVGSEQSIRLVRVAP